MSLLIFPKLHRFKTTHRYLLRYLITLRETPVLFLSYIKIPSWLILLQTRYVGIKIRDTPKKFESLPFSEKSSLSNLQDIWSIFNQFQPTVDNSYLFTKKPPTPSDIEKCLRGAHFNQCVSGIFAQHDKDYLTNVFNMPIPIEDVTTN